MTIDEIIFEALLRVSGGVLTSDSSVRYGEAKVYLVAAVNYVQVGNYWLENKMESEHAVNLMMMTPFDNVAIQYSTIRQRYYATLPVPVLSLSKGRSLSVTDESGKPFIPLTLGDEAMQEYYESYDKQLKYQLEGNTTIWLWGIQNNPFLKYIRPRYIASIANMPGTTQLLLPGTGEKDVLDLLTAWLAGEKTAPNDYVENGKDKVAS